MTQPAAPFAQHSRLSELVTALGFRRYRLFLTWDTVENHTKDFYGSADWQEWRKLVAHTFEGVPTVEHVREVLKAF